MTIDIKIPEFSESISEGTISTWVKNVGDHVVEGETLVEIETDKVVLEIPAPASGVIEKIAKSENETVSSHEVIGSLAESSQDLSAESTQDNDVAEIENRDITNEDAIEKNSASYKKTSPAVRKLIQEKNINIDEIIPTGKGNRVTKKDVLAAESSNPHPNKSLSDVAGDGGEIERVPMSSLRKKISDRLVSAQQDYAMLTTFNEVNMQEILSIRSKHKEQFFAQHGVKFGFMSFFVLATIEALKEYPIINASVEGDDILYHRYVDVGIAVSAERGLVVPVVRNAETKSLSSIEIEINELANKARENKLSIDELIGGTFTITNGGVFGSMLSTPIINPPQSAILGMHAIEKRPIADGDEIKIAPMMYLALSYDHRIIDGREAVLFLSLIKRIIENPIQLLLHL
ncbi:MAG: 2-oxoglutarate dehydrogenase complex dihydrolipoyllysine-residue succinyltransferase [Gammaproteobacteria bacterium]|nr:2-oxoglutarate dehydrogenase complex dihydrolipoyllysine-residue succinyltransferase [Gammaproteobacteria bacterium]